jgi:hypothetical protein
MRPDRCYKFAPWFLLVITIFFLVNALYKVGNITGYIESESLQDKSYEWLAVASVESFLFSFASLSAMISLRWKSLVMFTATVVFLGASSLLTVFAHWSGIKEVSWRVLGGAECSLATLCIFMPLWTVAFLINYYRLKARYTEHKRRGSGCKSQPDD